MSLRITTSVGCSATARVLVGGELTVEMLDLEFNPLTKYYVGLYR